MANEKKDLKEEAKPPGLEIEPLTDEDLETVAGGSSNSCCSCTGCSPPNAE
jgi:hypothetical protein